MSQAQQMNMGGPVGGVMAAQHQQQQQQQQQQQMNAGTPTNSGNPSDPQDTLNRLNAYIYEYFLRTQNWEVARAMVESGRFDLVRQSPSSRQPNGIDDSDPARPKDLPEPGFENPSDKPFLLDWWSQFWDIFSARRSTGKPAAISYVGVQRTAQKGRLAMMGSVDPAAQMRMGGNMALMNGMMPQDLKKAAMQNAGNMNPAVAARMQQQMRAQQGQMMQGQPMERSNSQMEMNGPRSNSPGSGDAPSPKRQRIEGNMQMRQPQGPQGPNNQGMPPNAAAMGPAGAQGSPLSQAGIDSSMGEYGPTGALRPGMAQNPGNQAAAGVNGGNHALQDYQMQLMLLEQQNKKRLLMARQEQDNITGPGMGNNGHFAPNMSPQGSRAGPSPNPNDMTRGTPQMQPGTSPNGQMQGRSSPAPGAFDPNQMQMRNPMNLPGANGTMMPRSHPGFPQGQSQLTQASMEILNQQAHQPRMMPNGTFPGGSQQMPPNMMPGQPGGPNQAPGQHPPNVTPRQGNMPPPPAPPMNGPGGTQPSSPAQSAAPPTPSQANKPKPGGKKDPKKGKKGGNQPTAPSTESEQPPTPTPQTPTTAVAPGSFHPNLNQGRIGGGMPNGGAPQPQPGQLQQQPNGMPQAASDMGQGPPFGNIDQNGGFDLGGMEFADLGNGGDVLDNFDFDSFLNNDDGSGFGALDGSFFEGSLEAGGDGMQ